MSKFYQKMLQAGENPVKALREAQLEMWNSPDRRSPYYWAAFTVQGDWRAWESLNYLKPARKTVHFMARSQSK